MKLSIFIIAVLSVFVSSCSDTKKTTSTAKEHSGNEALFKQEWKLTEVEGQPVPGESKAMLIFSEGEPGKVRGSSGCNSITGTFELKEKDGIQFSPFASTKMACVDENVNTLESNFLAVLSKVTSWQTEQNSLLLKSGETILAKLKTKKQTNAEELKLNGAWELNYISGPKIAFDGLFPNKKPVIVFDFPKEEANGNGGCNGYSVKVKVNGNKISFGDALSTMMACEGNGEPVYFRTLKTVTSYSISNNTLTMMMDDIAVMRFTKK